MSDCGKLIVVSGPSGAGKSTVISRVMQADKSVVFFCFRDYKKAAEGEREGVDYYFTNFDCFREMIENDELLEHAEYVDNYHGTPKAPVIKNLEKGLAFCSTLKYRAQCKSKAGVRMQFWFLLSLRIFLKSRKGFTQGERTARKKFCQRIKKQQDLSILWL